MKFLQQGLSLAVIGAGLAAMPMLPASAQPSDPDPAASSPIKKTDARDKLGQADRDLLAEAVSDGDKTVTVILATKSGEARDVAASVENLGGTVGKRVDRIGYVRATVPTKSVTKTAGLADVLKVDLNSTIELDDPSVDRGRAAVASAGPGASTPNDNPYMPTRETGAVAFKKANPRADGRGVTIGVLDSGVDLDHPALKRTSTGKRKIVDWVTATDPLLEGDGTWRAMLTDVEGPTFEYGGATWTSPEGEYSINRFSENITEGSEPEGDVNRDGDTTDRFGILYDQQSHDIWVDANQDFAFTDAEKMRPYKEEFDVGHFGQDDPATADVVESMPFVVEYREDVDLTPAGLDQTEDFVNIGITESAHGTHVAGITAANDMFGGKMDGAAPGAKIVSARACSWGGGCTAVALTEGMIDLVANRGVDVVNMSIGGLPALNDGNNARAELYDRLIDTYGVQLFISAGNSGPGLNTIGDPSVATDVVSVASSISKATWRSNYGSEVSSPLNLHNYSSRGPREDGGFKPNLMAPGSAVSTVPRWYNQSDVVEAGYTLPAGYAHFNGTSMASPQAAGAAALLLSKGYLSDRAIMPAQLRKALYTAADFVKGIPAAGQGNGQFDVVGTWKILAKSPRIANYTVSAPVCTPISDFLATPDQGTGIYNRCAKGEGGQAAGDRKAYKVTITRTSGTSKRIKHNLKWVGNDGTFTSPKSVVLPRNKPVTITVRAKPTAGVHSAILKIDDPRSIVVDHQMMATVVASKALPGPSYGSTTTSSVERNRTKSVFVTVPEGARALQVNLGGIAAGSQTRFIAINPYGVPIDSTSSLECYTNFSDASVCNPVSRAYADPLPGVWEIEVESRRTSPVLTNPYRLSAAVQGVTVTPETLEVPTAVAGEDTPVEWTVENNFGPVTLHGTGGPLGSSRSERATIAADGPDDEYEVEVPAGASRLDVAIGNTSDLGADLDLTVFDEEGNQVAQDADGDSEESVSIPNPAAGTYTVVVDNYDVPSGSTEYDYLDVFFSEELGTLTVGGGDQTLGNGETGTISGTLRAESAPEEGRELFGEMKVVSTEGAVLGTGAVKINEVTSAP